MSYARFSSKSDFYIWCGMKFHCLYGKQSQEKQEITFDTFDELRLFVIKKVSEGYRLQKSSQKMLEID